MGRQPDLRRAVAVGVEPHYCVLKAKVLTFEIDGFISSVHQQPNDLQALSEFRDWLFPIDAIGLNVELLT